MLRLLLYFFISNVCFSAYTQEYFHWKYFQGNNAKGVKTETVWKIEEDSTKSFFSYHEYDSSSNTIALRMYGKDTTFIQYDSYGNKISDGTKYIYRNGLKIEEQSDYDTIRYEYGSNGLVLKTNYTKRGIENLIMYDNYGRRLSLLHQVYGNIKIWSNYTYDSVLNTKTTYKNKIDNNGKSSCDTTIRYYDINNNFIKELQFYSINNQRRIQETEHFYDLKNKHIMTILDGMKIYFTYNDLGYIKSVKRYSSSGELKFHAVYKYKYW